MNYYTEEELQKMKNAYSSIKDVDKDSASSYEYDFIDLLNDNGEIELAEKIHSDNDQAGICCFLEEMIKA